METDADLTHRAVVLSDNTIRVDASPPAVRPPSGLENCDVAFYFDVYVCFDQELDDHNLDDRYPARMRELIDKFEVQVDGVPREVAGIENQPANGNRIRLVLSERVSAGQEVTVTYTDPDDNGPSGVLQDVAGNDAAGFGPRGTINKTPPNARPQVRGDLSAELREDDDYIITEDALGYFDPDGDAMHSVLIESVPRPPGLYLLPPPQQGTCENPPPQEEPAELGRGDRVLACAVADGRLVFRPEPNGNNIQNSGPFISGTSDKYSDFRYRVNDGQCEEARENEDAREHEEEETEFCDSDPATAVVRVTPVNDDPEFLDGKYLDSALEAAVFEVAENSAPGSRVIKVSPERLPEEPPPDADKYRVAAGDVDGDDLYYSLQGGDGFRIVRGGELRTAVALDHETVPEYVVCPAGQVTVRPPVSMAKSSRWNPSLMWGLRTMGFTTGVCLSSSNVSRAAPDAYAESATISAPGGWSATRSAMLSASGVLAAVRWAAVTSPVSGSVATWALYPSRLRVRVL